MSCSKFHNRTISSFTEEEINNFTEEEYRAFLEWNVQVRLDYMVTEGMVLSSVDAATGEVIYKLSPDWQE